MSKRVRGHLPDDVKINETAFSVLAEIARRSHGANTGIPVAMQELCELMDVSRASVRRSCHCLRDQGLITIEERFADDNGQSKNEYALTPKGLTVLVAVAYV